MSEQTPGPQWDDEPAVLGELGRALGHDPTAVPPPDRVEAIRAAAGAMSPPDAPVTELRRGRRRAFLAGGIAASVGGIAGFLVSEARQEEPTTPAAVPMETIAFDGDAEVTTSALINHTWGTELVLDVSGLTAGTAYDVVYATSSGEVAAGSLLAVDVLMKCRFNAAPLRADVQAIELREPSGRAVLRSELPAVRT